MSSPSPAPSSDRLESWKEIAEYLGRGVTTVRRWEREEGLPVRRLEHVKRGSVVAYKPELDAWLRSRETPLPEEPEPPRDGRRWIRVATAGACVAVVALGYGWSQWGEQPSIVAEVRQLTAYPGQEAFITFAPGGERFAYAEEPKKIWIKQVEHEPPRLFYTDPEGVCCPKWSPDGRWIAVAALHQGVNWEVLVLDALTGIPGPRFPGGPGLAWRPDSKAVIHAAGTPNAIHEWLLDSGKSRQLSSPPEGSWGDIHAAASPDGSLLAIQRYQAMGNGDIWVSRYGDREARRISHVENWIMGLDFVDDGRHVVFPGSWAGRMGLLVVPADGSGPPRHIPGIDGRATYPHAVRLSNGAWRVGYMVDIWNPDVVALDPVSGNVRPLAASTEGDEFPDLTADGRLVFMSDRAGSNQLWVCEAGCESPRPITRVKTINITMMPRWSPDAGRIAFGALMEGKNSILTIAPDGSGQRVLTTGADDRQPAWSHDGSAIYFRSDRSGRMEIWRVAASGGQPVQVTRNGGVESHASPDGRYLYLLRREEEAPLIRHALADGSETEVAGVPPLRQGHFALSGERIVFLDMQARRFRMLDPRTGEIREVCEAPEKLVGMSATAAGALAWSQWGPMQANLRAVDLRFVRTWGWR